MQQYSTRLDKIVIMIWTYAIKFCHLWKIHVIYK
jgi:hypothetical protein